MSVDQILQQNIVKDLFGFSRRILSSLGLGGSVVGRGEYNSPLCSFLPLI